MKRLILAGFVLFLFAVESYAQTDESKPRFEASQFFNSPKEAVEFANNKLLLGKRVGVQFVCEFQEGSPTPLTYKIVIDSRAVTRLYDLDLRWNYKEFSDLRAAKGFANLIGRKSQFVACLNPNLSPTLNTTTTIFYKETGLTGFGYEFSEKRFASVGEAVQYTNELPASKRRDVQLVPEFFGSQQLVSSWRVIIETGQGEAKTDADTSDANWSAIENDARGFLLGLSSAAEFANQKTAVDCHFASSFSSANIRSNVVLFCLANQKATADCHPASNFNFADAGGGDARFCLTVQEEKTLVIPTVVYATRTLIEKVGEKLLLDTMETIAKILGTINNASLDIEPKFRTIVATTSNPEELGRSVPRGRDQLAVILIDSPLQTLAEATNLLTEEKKLVAIGVGGWSDRGWVVVRFHPDQNGNYDLAVTKHRILHELGHQFGSLHSNESDSVMCSPLVASSCAKNSLVFDAKSAAAVLGGAKAIKRIGLETYSGLRLRN